MAWAGAGAELVIRCPELGSRSGKLLASDPTQALGGFVAGLLVAALLAQGSCLQAALDEALHGGDLDFAMVQARPGGGQPVSRLQRQGLPASESTLESLADTDAWLADYQSITGAIAQAPPAHGQMLRAIRGETRFLVSRTDGRAVCCGFGVISGRHLGLFQIATRPDSRGRGLATALCADLLRWAASRGAAGAFLQVEAANMPAVRIYELLGFRRHYHYWYRIG